MPICKWKPKHTKQFDRTAVSKRKEKNEQVEPNQTLNKNRDVVDAETNHTDSPLRNEWFIL
jgi:hypothetical protein